MWTKLMDMHSGGGCKLSPYENIFIEAPEKEACVVFYNRFKINPNRISCTCCGTDYSVSEYKTLEEATAYNRKDYDGVITTVDEYVSREEILVISAMEITPEEMTGDVPDQGYVWID